MSFTKIQRSCFKILPVFVYSKRTWFLLLLFLVISKVLCNVMFIRVGLTTLLMVEKEMIPIYSFLHTLIIWQKIIFFLRKGTFILSMRYRKTPSKLFDFLKCLIIVITEIVASESHCDLPNLELTNSYFSKSAEHR